jgi:hypothetical protein
MARRLWHAGGPITTHGGAKVTFDPTDIATFEELQKIILRLELDGRDEMLPAYWKPWTQPVPALPIDEFVTTLAGRNRKPRLLTPDDLRRHRLGACPYAMARSGVAAAIEFATVKDDLEDLKAYTTFKLGGLKTELPALESKLRSAISHISSIGKSQEFFHEFDNGALNILADRLILALVSIRETLPWIESHHLERSQHRGNLWRQAFVGSLFNTWWTLTNSDPSPSSGPFLEFIEKSWLSLSPEDLPEVSSWESPIRTCLRSDPERSWRREAPRSPVMHEPSGSEVLDAWVAGDSSQDL